MSSNFDLSALAFKETFALHLKHPLDGTLLYVGGNIASGPNPVGYVVSRSGFTNAAGTLQAPFNSGEMQQSIGISVSGGMFVMPNLCVIRSGFANSLPYDI